MLRIKSKNSDKEEDTQKKDSQQSKEYKAGLLTAPYRKAIIVMTAVSFLFLVMIISNLRGYVLVFSLLPATIIFFIIFSADLLLALMSIKDAISTNRFARSDRVLVKWIYTDNEWKKIMNKIKKEQEGDGKMVFWFVFLISAFVSLFVGIAAKDNYFAVAGFIFSFFLALTFSAAFSYADKSEYSQRVNQPDFVVLGEGELYYNNVYFRKTYNAIILKRWVNGVSLEGNHLFVELAYTRYTKPVGLSVSKQVFDILVPENKLAQVRKMVGRIAG
ncbi:MAG: hypothetical protein Q8O89_05305 [Nanoarchaeota archaeon]|nr:hypothetical protein [Nanoarchaeota archaeon]